MHSIQLIIKIRCDVISRRMHILGTKPSNICVVYGIARNSRPGQLIIRTLSPPFFFFHSYLSSPSDSLFLPLTQCIFLCNWWSIWRYRHITYLWVNFHCTFYFEVCAFPPWCQCHVIVKIISADFHHFYDVKWYCCIWNGLKKKQGNTLLKILLKHRKTRDAFSPKM